MAEITRYTEGTTSTGGRKTAQSVKNIRNAIRQGRLKCQVRTLKQGQRLDHVAFDSYNDGRLWWVIAAASDIGWAMQAPAGTQLRIPNLNDALQVM